MRHNVNEIEFEELTFRDRQVLFTDSRVDRDSIPDGLHMYELRHHSEDWGSPISVEKSVFVNFMGTIITKTPFDLTDGNGTYLSIDPDEEWDYDVTGDCKTIEDFMKSKVKMCESTTDLSYCKNTEEQTI